MVKFLPSYVGSKARWVEALSHIKGTDIVELFAGSAVLSANLAKTAILNDLDPYIYKILNEFDSLMVPDSFSQEDYFKVRSSNDWWKYAYCLQKMSFSGVFRYSKNGYNVPVKKNIKEIQIKEEFEEALKRYNEINPTILNLSYLDVPIELLVGKTVILDPPYEGSQASYNNSFDYHLYWLYVAKLEGIAKHIIIFDRQSNMPFEGSLLKNMRVNGKHKGDIESMFEFKESLKEGQKGEELFHKLFPSKLIKTSGYNEDFLIEIDDKTYRMELKSDYYDLDRFPNYFMERYSDKSIKSPGGPWQALSKGVDFYVYFFPKNKQWFVFKTSLLVEKLNKIVNEKNLIDIPNNGYTTQGYKINRNLLKDILMTHHIVGNE